MALTPTDFADLTAVGTYIAGVAEINALKATPFLNSGWFGDPGVSGAFAPNATSVNFPEFNASSIVAANLPADGSAVADSYTATEVFVNVPMVDKIVPYRYMPLATNRSIDGQALHLNRIGNHVAGLIGTTVQAAAVAKLVAAATAASQHIDANDDATITAAGLIKAAASTFAEAWNPADYAILLAPKVYGDLLSSTDVLAAHKSSVTDLSGNPLPSLLGMPLIMCSDLTLIDDGGGTGVDTYNTLIVRRGVTMAYLDNVNTTPPVHIPASGSDHIDNYFSYACHVSRAGNKVGVMTYETL